MISGRYVDSVLFGVVFDKTSTTSASSFRESTGEKFFAFTSAITPFSNAHPYGTQVSQTLAAPASADLSSSKNIAPYQAPQTSASIDPAEFIEKVKIKGFDFEWVNIPGGQINNIQDLLGKGRHTEQFIHQYGKRKTISGFKISRSPITVAQYTACINDGACSSTNGHL